MIMSLNAVCCMYATHVWLAEAMQDLQQRSLLFRSSRDDALALLRGWVIQAGFPLLNMSMDGAATPQGRFYAWGQPKQILGRLSQRVLSWQRTWL